MEPAEKEKMLASEADTIAFGVALAARLKAGDVIKITGPLGAGKTTLVRGLVQGLGGDPAEVHSPTFLLTHHYQAGFLEIIHCDFYRLPNSSRLEEFGGLEFFESDSIFFIEWPERIQLFESSIPNRLLGVDLRDNASSRTAILSGPW